VARESLVAMLENVPEIHVVASAGADHASLAETKPDVLLLDAGLSDDDALRVAHAVTKAMPSVKIIVMDLIAADEEIIEFVGAGVSGFILKGASFEEFVTTIRAVAGGAKVLPPRMTEPLFSQVAAEGTLQAREHAIEDMRMTRREREVIELIGVGLGNKAIAMRLNVSTHTVKSHVRNVMEKLALHTRLQLAAYSHGELKVPQFSGHLNNPAMFRAEVSHGTEEAAVRSGVQVGGRTAGAAW
jgi:DNA-binding NarL/FixJ family response regulator